MALAASRKRRSHWLLAAVISMGLTAVSAPAQAAGASMDRDAWAAKVQAAWLGKVAAGSGALPAEGMDRAQVERKFGVVNAPLKPPTPRGPLDDTTLALLGWVTARDHGAGFTAANVAQEWVAHLTDADLKGGGFGRETIDSLTRLRQGDAPPIRTGSVNMEGIAGQMRAEIWGLLAPGNPVLAADFAARDAGVFNTGNGVHAARFVAALTSRLMVDADIAKAIAVAQTQIPGDTVLARMVRDVLRWHGEIPGDWGRTWEAFTEAYRDRALEADLRAWSPDWLVETGGWPEAEVLPDCLGESRVLRTHPFTETDPARLTTELAVPASGGSLGLKVTCNSMPAAVDWLLRVRIGESVQEQPVRWVDGRRQWLEARFDLAPWAGRQVTVVLENAVLGRFAWEAGFWCVPDVRDGEGKPLHGRPPAGRPYRYPLAFTPKVLPETFSVLVGLLYGNGDFREAVSITTRCGFDTDCNAGTVGCLMALRSGLHGIPADWRDPVQDRYELQVTGLPREWSIADLARQIVETGMSLPAGPPG